VIAGLLTLTLLVSLTLLRDERQHYVGLVVVFEDLTAQKELAAQLPTHYDYLRRLHGR